MKKVRVVAATLLVATSIAYVAPAAYAGAEGRRNTALLVAAVALGIAARNQQKLDRERCHERNNCRFRREHDDRRCDHQGYFRDDRYYGGRNYQGSYYDPEHPPLYGGRCSRGTVIYDPVANRYPDGRDDRDR